MSVFVAKIPVHMGGRGKITVHRVVADCLEDWEDLLEYLAGEWPGKYWVVAPQSDKPGHWLPTSKVLPHAKVRAEVVPDLVEEFEAPVVTAGYLMWAEYQLKMEMRRQAGPIEQAARTHHVNMIRGVAYRLRKHGLAEEYDPEFQLRGQREQVKTINSAIENLDLGKWRRLNPPQMDSDGG